MSCKNDPKSAPSDYDKAFGSVAGPSIHFVIPTGFRGEIQIVEDKNKGLVIPRDGGRLVVNVPPDGRVAVLSFQQFEGDHTESASYADGSSIPIPAEAPTEFPRDKVAFYNGGTLRGGRYSQETVVYFVGTKQELENLK